ncbi:hypothetical protein V565_263160, partial [Rhizoctonia solani 123E]
MFAYLPPSASEHGQMRQPVATARVKLRHSLGFRVYSNIELSSIYLSARIGPARNKILSCNTHTGLLDGHGVTLGTFEEAMSKARQEIAGLLNGAMIYPCVLLNKPLPKCFKPTQRAGTKLATQTILPRKSLARSTEDTLSSSRTWSRRTLEGFSSTSKTWLLEPTSAVASFAQHSAQSTVSVSNSAPLSLPISTTAATPPTTIHVALMDIASNPSLTEHEKAGLYLNRTCRVDAEMEGESASGASSSETEDGMEATGEGESEGRGQGNSVVGVGSKDDDSKEARDAEDDATAPKFSFFPIPKRLPAPGSSSDDESSSNALGVVDILKFGMLIHY